MEQKPRRHAMVVYARYPLGETRVQREAEELARRGFAVDVICREQPGLPRRDAHRGIEIYREPFRFPLCRPQLESLPERFLNYGRFFLAARRRLEALHRARPYDSIQIHNLPDFLVFCAGRLKRQGIPVILDLHDLMPEFFAGRFGRRHAWLRRLIAGQERAACRFADHVITVSHHWREALIRRGVPAARCSVVMNVADPAIFPPASPEPGLRRPDGFFRLFYHGILVERNGLDLAIRAVSLLRDRIPRLRLSLLGVGDAVPRLRALVRELDLDSFVAIDNRFRPAEELAPLIHGADLGVVPYRNDVFTDGLVPTKLMEYASAGLPAVASRTSAIAHYFGGTMAELFEPNDAGDLANHVERLYREPERRLSLARGCLDFTRRYNWGLIGAEYAALVERASLPRAPRRGA